MLELSEFKKILNIDVNNVEKDGLLNTIINSSFPIMENYIGNKIIPSQIVEKHRGTESRFMALDYFPVISLDSATEDGVDIIDSIYLEDGGKTGIVSYDGWFNSQLIYAYTYTAGYSTIPQDIEYAQMLLCQHLYYQFDRVKGGVDSIVTPDGSFIYDNSALPKQVVDILQKYRKPWL